MSPLKNVPRRALPSIGKVGAHPDKFDSDDADDGESSESSVLSSPSDDDTVRVCILQDTPWFQQC
jgi:hypothetical protein